MKSKILQEILDETPKEVEIFVQLYADLVVRINQLLREKQVSKKELAERMEKSPSEISKWLSGKHNFTLRSLAKLSAELGEPLLEVPGASGRSGYTVAGTKQKKQILVTHKNFPSIRSGPDWQMARESEPFYRQPMQDKPVFDLEKIVLLDFQLIKAQTDTPENFDAGNLAGYQLEHALQLGINLKDHLVKVEYKVEIETRSKRQNAKETRGYFHLMFIYQVENLNELAKPVGKDLSLHPALGNALSSVTYSTARGILLTRLQGTALQNFMLPLSHPDQSFFIKSP